MTEQVFVMPDLGEGLEEGYLPSVERIAAAARTAVAY